MASSQADEVALALTGRWQLGDTPKIRKPLNGGPPARANGHVLRALRRPQHGLLLIYPVMPPEAVVLDENRLPEPTGLDPAGPPIIAVALSFPTSDTTVPVEYRVNKVWETEIAEDDAYED